MNRKDLWKLYKTTAKKWLENNAPLRAAALTFFYCFTVAFFVADC
jgi:uncharacterized BrkB/YihY/UPF0761 family membrane protein